MKILYFGVIVITLFCVIVSKNPPFELDVYTEALCPYCKRFLTIGVKNFLDTPGSEELAKINLVTYGNAEEKFVDGKYVFECQHGPSECVGNLLSTCSINLWDNIFANKFVICLEEKYSGDFLSNSLLKGCLNGDDTKVKQLLDCYYSPDADKLQHEMAVKTYSLQPALEYVPFVYTDKKPDVDATAGNLIKYLCAKRADANEIKVCSKPFLALVEAEDQLLSMEPEFCLKKKIIE